MRRGKTVQRLHLATLALCAASGVLFSADEDFERANAEREPVSYVLSDPEDVFRLTQGERPLGPRVPSVPPVETPLPRSSERLMSQLYGEGDVPRSMLEEIRRDRARSGATEYIPGMEARQRVTSDVGNLLGKTGAASGVSVQRRTPIITDPRVRGARVGQLLASGSYWVPARMDLDTLLSKVDSRILQDVIVINGPYSSVYGPGHNFIDFKLKPAPRFEERELHAATVTDYQTNGQQLYGRQSAWGGNTDWGFRFGYGYRTGNDYRTGGELSMPSSYRSGTFDAAAGWDPTPDSHLDVNYLRLDQADVEFPGQIFDIDALTTDAFELTYTLEDQPWFDLLRFEPWYNRTHFDGNAQRSSKRKQIPFLSGPLDYVGFTNADTLSTGYTLALTWGAADESHASLGTDLRFVTQELNEFSTFNLFDPISQTILRRTVNSPIPPSHMTNPGLFTEETFALEGQPLRVRTGGRLDFASMNVDSLPERVPGINFTEALLKQRLRTNTLQREMTLFGAFTSTEYDITDDWTLQAGAGYSERPPTLTELYAVSPFMALLQHGFTAVRGTPQLSKERMLQLDAGLVYTTDRFRGGLRGFHSWVYDYITFQPESLQDSGTGGAFNVAFVNTPLATLDGAELRGEYDATAWLTPFATLNYVYGMDRTRDERDRPDFMPFPGGQEPLPGIVPLESRFGVRVHETTANPQWWLELMARAVARQTRVAGSLDEKPTPGFTTLDLRGYWTPRPSWQLYAGVENMTNRFYREHLDLRTGFGVFQPGISFYMGSEFAY